jgi:hypothetical protein
VSGARKHNFSESKLLKGLLLSLKNLCIFYTVHIDIAAPFMLKLLVKIVREIFRGENLGTALVSKYLKE